MIYRPDPLRSPDGRYESERVPARPVYPVTTVVNIGLPAGVTLVTAGGEEEQHLTEIPGGPGGLLLVSVLSSGLFFRHVSILAQESSVHGR